MINFNHHTQFITITNLYWKSVLQKKEHKEIIFEALRTRVEKNQVTIYGFVIMPNHMHLIWQLHDVVKRDNFQRDFLKFTARSIIKFMTMNDDPMLKQLKVNTSDRKYQVWERNSLSIDIYSEKVFLQKLNYIHNNPMQEKWKLANFPEEYPYSSAKFYETGIDDFGWLSHFRG